MVDEKLISIFNFQRCYSLELLKTRITTFKPLLFVSFIWVLFSGFSQDARNSSLGLGVGGFTTRQSMSCRAEFIGWRLKRSKSGIPMGSSIFLTFAHVSIRAWLSTLKWPCVKSYHIGGWKNIFSGYLSICEVSSWMFNRQHTMQEKPFGHFFLKNWKEKFKE